MPAAASTQVRRGRQHRASSRTTAPTRRAVKDEMIDAAMETEAPEQGRPPLAQPVGVPPAGQQFDGQAWPMRLAPGGIVIDTQDGPGAAASPERSSHLNGRGFSRSPPEQLQQRGDLHPRPPATPLNNASSASSAAIPQLPGSNSAAAFVARLQTNVKQLWQTSQAHVQAAAAAPAATGKQEQTKVHVPTASWVTRMMEEQARVLGEHLHQEIQSSISQTNARVDNVDQEAWKLHDCVRAQAATIAQLQQKAADTDKALKDKADAIEQKLNNLSECSTASDAASTCGSTEIDTPFEQRTTGLCGNIGALASGPEIEARFSDIIQRVGLQPASMLSWNALKQQNGNMIEVFFTMPQELAKARSMMARAALTLQGGNGRPTWLNAKKTRRGGMPSRHTHHSYERLCQLPTARRYGDRLVKNAPAASISLDGEFIGYSDGAQWCWTARAEQAFDEEAHKMAKAFAELP